MKLLLSVIGLALATLRENKVRSFLTVLGVIIGTGTIIAVGSILAGLDGAVTGVIRSMGTNTAMVFKMRMGPELQRPHRRRTQSQTADLRKRRGHRRSAAPRSNTSARICCRRTCCMGITPRAL